ncbi:hypothetical protein [Streptomyces sp. NPDC002788]
MRLADVINAETAPRLYVATTDSTVQDVRLVAPIHAHFAESAPRPAVTGRSTTLSQAAGRALAELFTPPTAASVHPWEGWTFSAGWGTQRVLDVHLVQPDIVMEVAVDIARDAAGRCPYGTPCAHEHACIRCPMLSIGAVTLLGG